MSIQLKIKKRLLAQGMTMTGLSNKSGVSYSTVQRYLSGESEVSSDKFIKILDSIGLNIDQALSSENIDLKVRFLPKYLRESLLKVIGG